MVLHTIFIDRHLLSVVCIQAIHSIGADAKVQVQLLRSISINGILCVRERKETHIYQQMKRNRFFWGGFSIYIR